MAIAYQSNDWNFNNGATTVIVGKPTGVASGDLLIASYNVYNNENAVATPPSGWTLLTSTTQGTGTGSTKHWIYWKIAGGSEPTTYTFDATLANYADCAIFRYTGHHPTNPISVYSVNGSSTTTRTGTAVTTPIDNSVLVMSTVGYGFAITSGPSGMTSRLNYDTVIYWYDQTVHRGSTGNKTATQSGSDSSTTIMFVINPALAVTTRYTTGLNTWTTGSPFTTTGFVPNPNSLLVVMFGCQESNPQTAPTFTVSGGGLTWSRQKRHTGGIDVGPLAEIWTAQCGPSPGSITVTLTMNTGSILNNNMYAVAIVDVIGHNPSAPFGLIASDGSNTSYGTNFTASLGGTSAPNSVVISLSQVDQNGNGQKFTAVNSGWTEIYRTVVNTWWCELFQYRIGAISTVDHTIVGESLPWNMAAIEIREAAINIVPLATLGDTGGGWPQSSTLTTSSFTPPPNSVLVIMADRWQLDSVVITNTAGLTFTERYVISRDDGGNIPASAGYINQVRVFTAPVGASPSSMTITIDYGNDYGSAGVAFFALTGAVEQLRQTKYAGIGSDAQSFTLDSAPIAINMVVSFRVATIGGGSQMFANPGSDWTELYDMSEAANWSFQIQYRVGSVSTSVSWTDTDVGDGIHNSSGLGAAVEFVNAMNATIVSSPPFFRPRPLRVFRQRF